MIVTVYGASIGAAAHLHGLPLERWLRFRLLPGSIAAEATHWRPVRHRWRGYRAIERSEFAGPVDNLAADDREVAGRVRDLGIRAGKIVTVRHDQVGELPDLDAALLAFLIGEPGDVLGPHVADAESARSGSIWRA